MIQLITFLLSGADKKQFVHWLMKYFMERKGDPFTNGEIINNLQIYYTISEVKDFHPENQFGRILIEGFFYYYSEGTEGGGLPKPFILNGLPIDLYYFDLVQTTKGLEVTITGRPSIIYEGLLQDISKKWDIEYVQTTSQSVEVTPTTTSPASSLPVQSINQYEKQIEKAISLLQGIDNNDKNKIIIEDWWRNVPPYNTAVKLQHKELADINQATVYNYRCSLNKKYGPGIVPPSKLHDKKSRYCKDK